MENQFFSNDSEKINEIKTPIIKVRGRTLIFANSIYQIRNISSLEIIDLSTVKPMPRYFLVLLVVGLVLLLYPDGGSRVLGVVTLGVLGWLFYSFQENKQRTRYGLSMRLNAGIRDVIVGDDIEFLKQVMLVLYNIMNSDELKAINMSFDQRNIEDKSINIDKMLGSNVVTGNVHGDIVGNV